MTTKSVEPSVSALRAVATYLASKIPLGEHTEARAIAGEVARLADGAEALARLNSNRDPTITDAAHVKRVADAAAKLGKATTTAMNRIGELSRRGHDDIAARIKAKTRLVPDVFGNEIRDQFRRMGQEEKTKLLAELVEDPNRGSELAAILVAPLSATGLSAEARSKWEQVYVARHAPDELNEQLVLTATCEGALSVGTPTAGKVEAAYSSPTRIAEIARAEAAANAVAATFDRSVA